MAPEMKQIITGYFPTHLPLNGMNAFADQHPKTSSNAVLLADDDQEDRAFMNDFFHRQNYTTVLFDSGLNALEYLLSLTPEHLPAVVILDYSMPLLNGEDLLHIIKSTDGLKHLPVVVYSSEMNEGMRGRLIAAGAIACFLKTAETAGYDTMKELINVLLDSSATNSDIE